MANPSFTQESYHRHSNWYQQQFPETEQKLSVLRKFKTYQGSINYWLQALFFDNLTVLLKDKDCKWLTVGDAYGHDAAYLLSQDVHDVLATDLNDNLLSMAKELGLVKNYQKLNAEQMDLEDDSIDYVLCKESYHHFPRPYAALYEMSRVARKGLILMEPQDPILKMPFLLFLGNCMNRIHPNWLDKIWKNRFSYESVGNFVYKVSEREFEKFAAGMNFSTIACREFNPNFWFQGSSNIQAKFSEKKFRSIYVKKAIRDFLKMCGLIPAQTLCLIAFIDPPADNILRELKGKGFRITKIRKNPYLQ